jgi:hypothetical protein
VGVKQSSDQEYALIVNLVLLVAYRKLMTNIQPSIMDALGPHMNMLGKAISFLIVTLYIIL